ncbi:unnamed protein product, partial [Ectocarpus fasciculatus]
MVSQAASIVKTEAVNVLIAVEAVEAAADRATEAVSVAQAAKAAAAAKSAAAKAAVEAAKAAHAAAAALEADLEPAVTMAEKRMTSGGSSGGVDQGAASSSGSEVMDGDFNAEAEAVESEISAHDGEDNDISPTVKVLPWAGSTYPEPDGTPGKGCLEGEEQEEEEEEKHEEHEEEGGGKEVKARRGKRKLEVKVNAPRRQIRHNYAGSSTIGSSKPRPMDPAPATSSGGTGAAATSKVAKYGHGICQEHGCTKSPSFGTKGTTKAVFCSPHAKRGMIDIRNKKCAHPGC